MSDTPVSTVLRSPRALLFGGVFLTIVVVLVGVYLLVLRQTYAVLVADARPMEAAAIVAELEEQGIPYQLRDRGQTILVPTARAAGAHLMIAGAETLSAGAPGLEIFEESNMGLTEFAQRVRYQRAITGEMVRTILMMDNISDVRVHVAMPENGLFRGEDNAANAAIWVATQNGVALDSASVEGIRRLAVAAVPDLRVENVAVLDSGGSILTAEPVAQTVDVDPMVLGQNPDILTEEQQDLGIAVSQPSAPSGLEVGGPEPAGTEVLPQTPDQTLAVGTPEDLTDPLSGPEENTFPQSLVEQSGVEALPPQASASSSSLPGGVINWILGGLVGLACIYYLVTRHLLPRPAVTQLEAPAPSFATHLEQAPTSSPVASASASATPDYSADIKSRLEALEASGSSPERSGVTPRAAEALGRILAPKRSQNDLVNESKAS